MGPNKIYELIVTIINALGVAFTDTDKQALFTVLPYVINTDNGYANDCSMNSIYKHMTEYLEISRSAAESRLRRALKRLMDNVDRMTYQQIFKKQENNGTQDSSPMSQHTILYFVVEYVVDRIHEELSEPSKDGDISEPDCNCLCDSACNPDCECTECHCEDSRSAKDTKSHTKTEKTIRKPFQNEDCTKKSIISDVLNQFSLPFICHTEGIVIDCLTKLIDDDGHVVEFTYSGMNPDFSFMDKVSLFFDILSFETDLFDGLTKGELQNIFHKKTKMLMKPSNFMMYLAIGIINLYAKEHGDAF